MNKDQIRGPLFKRRKLLSHTQIKHVSDQVVSHIMASDLWGSANHVAIYLPFKGEIDLTALLQVKHKDIYLPAIEGQSMQFQLHRPELIVRKHAFGMHQPDFIPLLEPPQLDLCLMPLVAFDAQGNRLGMGAGFYDRYFAGNQATTMVGVAHQFQRVEQLPVDPWDVKLQHIFTEQGHHEF